MLLLLLALQATPAPVRSDSVPAADSIPRISLGEAIRRSARLDPDYVRALGQIENAEWGRRAAMLAFFVPSLELGLSETKYSQRFFNPANPANPTSTLVVGQARANYEVFSLRKFSELSRTKAELASTEAGELEQRFQAALETESSYYDVLVNQELTRVTQERVVRARQGLAVARARVTSGAAVQTDSLQLVLELIRAQVEGLRQRNAFRTAQLELGRRVGASGPVDAVPSDTAPAPKLPVSLAEAVRIGLDQGPQYRAARANEGSAEAALRSQRGDYLPVFTIGGLHQRYDTQQTATAAVELARAGVTVASQNYRMQELRYRSGATTILDLLDAQVSLAEAEAGLVQARYQTRLALARLEAILGRRLFSNKDLP
jgi:outer membrane protein TolC